MSAEDRFMDLLLERALGDDEVVAWDRDEPLRPVRRSARRWWWSAAAVLLVVLGAVFLLRPDTERDGPPQGMVLLAGTEYTRQGPAIRIDRGFALVDETAPPVIFDNGVMQAVGGRVVVSASGIPTGSALAKLVNWVAKETGRATDVSARLSTPSQWFLGKGGALALLSGGVLLSGDTDLAWAGRTWTRSQGDAPLRVALVATADTVGRLGRLSNAIKLADVNAKGDFAKALGRVSTLTHIDVSGCVHVSDAAVRHIGRLQGLALLDLSFTNVGNRGLAWLTPAEALTGLSLRGLTSVTAEGLRIVADTHAHALTRLDIRDGATVTADVITALGRCKKLASLALTLPSSTLAEEDLAPLQALSALRVLHIAPTVGTPYAETVQFLRTLLPNCEIRVAPSGTPR